MDGAGSMNRFLAKGGAFGDGYIEDAGDFIKKHWIAIVVIAIILYIVTVAGLTFAGLGCFDLDKMWENKDPRNWF